MSDQTQAGAVQESPTDPNPAEGQAPNSDELKAQLAALRAQFEASQESIRKLEDNNKKLKSEKQSITDRERAALEEQGKYKELYDQIKAENDARLAELMQAKQSTEGLKSQIDQYTAFTNERLEVKIKGLDKATVDMVKQLYPTFENMTSFERLQCLERAESVLRIQNGNQPKGPIPGGTGQPLQIDQRSKMIDAKDTRGLIAAGLNAFGLNIKK